MSLSAWFGVKSLCMITTSELFTVGSTTITRLGSRHESALLFVSFVGEPLRGLLVAQCHTEASQQHRLLQTSTLSNNA